MNEFQIDIDFDEIPSFSIAVSDNASVADKSFNIDNKLNTFDVFYKVD